jgi:hypothetical protein
MQSTVQRTGTMYTTAVMLIMSEVTVIPRKNIEESSVERKVENIIGSVDGPLE